MMAARSLIQLFRKINPQMLQRKYRNKPTESIAESTPLEYGASKAKSYIPGSEVLSLEPSTAEEENVKDEDEGNDSDGSWVNVSHSEDELEIDSDDSEDDDVEDEDEDSEDESEDPDDDDKDVTSEKIPLENEDKTTVSPAVKVTKRKKKNIKKEGTESKKALKSLTLQEEQEKAMAVSQSRLLTQEDFRKLKVAQIAKEVRFAKGKKRKAETALADPEVKRNEIVSLKDIEKLHKRPKPNKESRLATVLEGREGREKFGSRKKKKNPMASKTQKQHNKNKAFNMIKHKVRSKIKRSFRDKQNALRNALIKRRKNK